MNWSSSALVLSTVICGFVAGCSRPAVPADAASPTSRAKTDPPGRRVTGRVLTPPGLLGIVMLRPSEPREFAPPTAPPVQDQIARMFAPELVFARAGLPVVFRNSDAYLHNVNVKNELTRDQAFNVAIPSGSAYAFSFASEGVYDVRCDIHPEMMAWVVAAPSPYATQTAPDGRFSFDDVQPGSYVLAVYLDKRRIEQNIEVGGVDEEITIDAQGS